MNHLKDIRYLEMTSFLHGRGGISIVNTLTKLLKIFLLTKGIYKLLHYALGFLLEGQDRLPGTSLPSQYFTSCDMRCSSSVKVPGPGS